MLSGDSNLNRHLVLLGDSIFDNASYVPDGLSVIEQLRGMLPAEDRASLVAVDGSTVASTVPQLPHIPADATHLFLSVGGNDALRVAGNTFTDRVGDVRTSLHRLAGPINAFRSAYRGLVQSLQSRRLPLTVCTVYDAIPGLDASEITGLCLFNDAITRTAIEFHTGIIDLRHICTQPSDYAEVSPIEPSASGGEKIARAIVENLVDSEHHPRSRG